MCEEIKQADDKKLILLTEQCIWIAEMQIR